MWTVWQSQTAEMVQNIPLFTSFSLLLEIPNVILDRSVDFKISSSDFLKRKQMLLLFLPLSPGHLLLLEAAFGGVVLLCLPVLRPRHGQSFSSALLFRASSLHGLLFRRKPASLLALSQAAHCLFFLAVSLFELLFDQQPLYQQSPVWDHPLFSLLKVKKRNSGDWTETESSALSQIRVCMLASMQFEAAEVIAALKGLSQFTRSRSMLKMRINYVANFKSASLVEFAYSNILVCVLLLLYLFIYFFRMNFIDRTTVFTDSTNWRRFKFIVIILLFLWEGFELFYHPPSYIFNQNPEVGLYVNIMFWKLESVPIR